tara:strand:- start:4533 stop:5117 length:585 start_codon:yes stop_codon:yes gene_type:complete
MKRKRTLVLNADYQGLGLIGWQSAMKQVVKYQLTQKDGAHLIDWYNDDFILSCNGDKFPVPAVIRRAQYVKKKHVPFSKKNVFLRDQMTCQYCGKLDLTCYTLTYDHVVPRKKWKLEKRKGTPTHWGNIVTCCRKCNLRKGDKTPEQAGLRLKKEPRAPSSHMYILGITPWTNIEPEWESYLTPLYKLLTNGNG